MAFSMTNKNSILGHFPFLPPRPTPLKNAKLIFIVVSQSLNDQEVLRTTASFSSLALQSLQFNRCLFFGWCSQAFLLEIPAAARVNFRMSEQGGLSLRGVAVTTEAATTAETAETVKIAKTVMKAISASSKPTLPTRLHSPVSVGRNDTDQTHPNL